MEKRFEHHGRSDAALQALAAVGCFCVFYTVHLLCSSGALTTGDYLAMALIVTVLLTACATIYHEYWSSRKNGKVSIKKLRIRELNEGAAIEFDGRQYRVDTIDRSKGEILVHRIGHPGSILVQIEGES